MRDRPSLVLPASGPLLAGLDATQPAPFPDGELGLTDEPGDLRWAVVVLDCLLSQEEVLYFGELRIDAVEVGDDLRDFRFRHGAPHDRGDSGWIAQWRPSVPANLEGSVDCLAGVRTARAVNEGQVGCKFRLWGAVQLNPALRWVLRPV